MAELVYALCALTSLVCALMLGRAYRRSRSRLLMWSMFCFIGLFANNVLTFVDLVLVPGVDLHVARSATGLGATMTLVVGLVWEAP